jgi:hypothetical protein
VQPLFSLRQKLNRKKFNQKILQFAHGLFASSGIFFPDSFFVKEARLGYPEFLPSLVFADIAVSRKLLVPTVSTDDISGYC